ncbi:DgyrCDS13263 [Dimorphilus gyrociliatus]|nr:DgyrCDS13263 [Dimorphilus gyrociliatus]
MSVTETTGVSGYSNAGFSKSEADSDSWPEEDREKKDVALDMDDGDFDDENFKDEELKKKLTPEEEKILEVLREVVRRCTNPDPMKRPTAAEVLEMLNKCPVPQEQD